MKRYCLIGVKGIGKTTLIKSILEKIPHIDYLIGSQILRQLVGAKFKDFDYFPEDEKQFYRKQAIKFMIDRQKKTKKDILVDGHTSLFNPKLNEPENVFTELDCKFFTDLILYEENTMTILKRRKKDLQKNRIKDISIIKKELAFERSNAHNIAKSYGMKMHYLNGNDSDDLKIKLINILKGEGSDF